LDSRTKGLRMEPKKLNEDEEWELTVYSDSDWAGDKDTRLSVTGYCILLQGVVISWKSKGQKSVALSSSEAELIALSEAVKEVKFIAQLLESMGMKVKLPIVCRVDNTGAIFIAENATTSSRTKHIDTRYHFVRELTEEGFIKILFVKTKENIADMFTKNVSGNILDDHEGTFIADKVYIEEDKKKIDPIAR